jgi:hypothetical protein
MNPPARRPLPMACVLVGALALVIAAAPDTAFTAMLSSVLRRSSKPQTISDWHRLQVVALAVAAISGALGWFGFARWRTIEPVLDRLGRVLGRQDRGWVFDGVLVLLLLGVLHGTSLAFGELRADDYIFLKEAHLPLSDSILLTWGGHVFPLWRFESALLDRLWGPHSAPFRWWLFANVALLAFLQARILAAWRISRSARLVGVVILCGWTQWAQVTMGYWTLSITVKVWIATSIAVLAVIGDGRLTATRKAIIAVAGLAAILEDTTGAIVVPALVVAALATGLRDGLPVRVLIRRAAWPVAIAITCTTAFLLGQWLVHLDAKPLLGAVGGGSFIHEALYLMGVGTVGMLFAPMVTTQLPPGLSGVIAIVLSAGVAWGVWMAWRRGSREERAPLGHNVALYLFGLSMVVGARPYANYYFMVGWTHYIAFLYVPTAAAIAVAWHEARRTAAWSPALEAQFLLIGCAMFLGAQEAGSLISDRLLLHGGRRWEQRDALNRHAMIALLRDSLFTPLESIVPRGGRVPQMLSTSLDVRFPNLQPLLPLSFYDEAAGISRGRFRWVVGPNPNGDVSDPIDATPVTRMRSVVDPAFQSALHRASWWRDTYFATTPLEPTATDPIACEALRRGAEPFQGDAERRHWLLLYVDPSSGTELPAVVDVVFRTGFRPRAVYQVGVGSQMRGCLRVELLSLPEMALSDTVEVLGLQNTSSRRIEPLGLFPPADRHRSR